MKLKPKSVNQRQTRSTRDDIKFESNVRNGDNNTIVLQKRSRFIVKRTVKEVMLKI
jgi:hypothetical protein